ncbi:hypothetical protein V2G26_008160 [Clonostachys chloroleuca]
MFWRPTRERSSNFRPGESRLYDLENFVSSRTPFRIASELPRVEALPPPALAFRDFIEDNSPYVLHLEGEQHCFIALHRLSSVGSRRGKRPKAGRFWCVSFDIKTPPISDQGS